LQPKQRVLFPRSWCCCAWKSPAPLGQRRPARHRAQPAAWWVPPELWADGTPSARQSSPRAGRCAGRATWTLPGRSSRSASTTLRPMTTPGRSRDPSIGFPCLEACAPPSRTPVPTWPTRRSRRQRRSRKRRGPGEWWAAETR
ncbi:unnamed protein product, partial [Effrenium voratum]